MSETMNSRCFSCTRLPADPELGESLTRMSLQFASRLICNFGPPKLSNSPTL
jgi:hypothetical protein